MKIMTNRVPLRRPPTCIQGSSTNSSVPARYSISPPRIQRLGRWRVWRKCPAGSSMSAAVSAVSDDSRVTL